MSIKNKLVPKTRFPEFRGAGTWKVKRLGELSKIVRGGSPRPIDIFLTTNQKGLNWLKIGDVDKNSKYVTHTQERVRIEALHKTREVNPGDLILSNSMSFGRPYILKIKSCIHDGWIAITQINNQVDRDYLYYLILSPSSQAYFFNNAAGSGVQNLNADIIKSLPILVPKSAEQQKIAACLTSVDDLITAHAQKLTQLKAHKKGLMQQLFPAEGETIPVLRFPEFRDAGDWEESLLGPNTTKIGSGITPRGGEKMYKKCGRPFVRSQNIGWGHLLLDDVAFIDEETHSTFSATEIKENDVFLNISGASIGRSAIADDRVTGGNVNQHVCIIRVKASALNSIFLNQFLNSAYGQSQIDSFQAGGNRQGLNFGQIRSFSIPMPKEKEQLKIAEFLSSLDDLIIVHTQKLDALKAHKKGLMQQLFPAADEVNG